MGSELPEVMVRGFGGEPTKLLMGEKRGSRHVEVFSLARSASIGFPIVDVFAFDQGLFDQLSDAYQRGDKSALGELWKSAAPPAPQ